MNAQIFLANFGHIASAPNGIKRLREMIYYLGVIGALCPQDREEGNGAALLEDIEREKQTRFEQGLFKRSLKFENLIETFTESLPDIPETWVWTRLVDIGEINPKNVAEDDTLASFASMSTISEMHAVPPQPEKRLWGTIKKGFTHLANGDVVVAKITPCFENGKAAIISDLTGGIGAGTTELHVVRPLPGVEPTFIYIFLRSPYFKTTGETHMTGTAGQKRLPTEYFATRPLPLPPLLEQKRIVAKVDELMLLCDKLEAQQLERKHLFPVLSRACHARFTESPTFTNLKAIFDKTETVSLDDLRKTVLTLAVRGRIVPQDQNEESASDLIARIKQNRERIAKKQGVRPPKVISRITEENYPHDIPKSWQWERLGRLALVIDYGTSQKAHSDSSKVPVYRMGNIVGGRLIDENLKYVDASIKDLPRLYLKFDDILFNRTNSFELVGKTGIFKGHDDTATFASYLIRIRLPSTILFPDYFCLAMNAPYYRQSQIEPEIIQQCGQANFNGNKLAATTVPVPPLAEQFRIVDKVNLLMILIDQLEEQQNKKIKVVNTFVQAVATAITGSQIQKQ